MRSVGPNLHTRCHGTRSNPLRAPRWVEWQTPRVQTPAISSEPGETHCQPQNYIHFARGQASTPLQVTMPGRGVPQCCFPLQAVFSWLRVKRPVGRVVDRAERGCVCRQRELNQIGPKMIFKHSKKGKSCSLGSIVFLFLVVGGPCFPQKQAQKG